VAVSETSVFLDVREIISRVCYSVDVKLRLKVCAAKRKSIKTDPNFVSTVFGHYRWSNTIYGVNNIKEIRLTVLA